MCSIVILVIGFVCGIVIKMIVDKKRKCSTNNIIPAEPDSTIYEDIQMETRSQKEDFYFEENQAYGPISINA